MDIGRLKEAGIDYETARKRFGGKAELLEKYLVRFPDDESYPGMVAGIEQKDYVSAFKHAHTMKGVVGSLGMDELYQSLLPLVESLRHKELAHIQEQLDSVTECYRRIIEAVK